MENHSQARGRREFLWTLGGGALGLALAGSGFSAGTKPLRGVFPIGQTPVDESDKLDLECLQNQVKFCNRFKVHGFAWPQIASGWASLSEKERMDGAEAILAAGKGGATALVIGVQNKEGNVDKSIAYARHAAKNGADAIISLPPEKAEDKAMIEYYKTIGQATDLPLIVQSQGDMSVDLIVELAKQVPTMRCVKDEAGNPLARIAQIRQRTNDKLAVFSGNGVRTMIDEMRLGFSGHCPTTALSDFYAATFDLWHAGKQREAFDMFGRIQAFNSITGASGYLMVVRGVFKENTKTRAMSMASGGRGGSEPGGGVGRGPARPLDEAGKQAVRDAWDEFMKPYLRG
ncbi:MAG TPA: dihydrodipicolinate synthase family protein [Bryobacteraceae bacterium]|jgi:4-hydroxy-tetrahydrodipicolinate synthase